MIIKDFDWDAYENNQVNDEINIEEQRLDNEKLLNAINNNEIIEGIIISINKREVIVNVGYIRDGIISASEFRYNPNLKIGDVVEVIIEKETSINKYLIISHKKARLKKTWEKVKTALENNETIKSGKTIRAA